MDFLMILIHRASNYCNGDQMQVVSIKKHWVLFSFELSQTPGFKFEIKIEEKAVKQ